MGQSYDDNAVYVGWSPLFNYNTVETLGASKFIPTPKNITITKSATGYDISEQLYELEELCGNEQLLNVLSDVSTKANAPFIKKLAEVIELVEKHSEITTSISNQNTVLDKLISVINQHEHYHVPDNVNEQAFKNNASANIYNVSHDIRNRDQAYTAIAMGIMRKAANNSPKGNQAATLNMLNPNTKYIMQYQNLVGKDVISVAANGEKVWFNTFYYWTKVLKTGDSDKIHRLKFEHTYSRIQGRAKGELADKTVKCIPDLNKYDKEIRQALLHEFNISTDSMEYAYVDQLISQLLSAATDNAKELILAKINAGTNFARMYIYGMMVGLNINDLVAFMTSPFAELIDSFANPNFFQNESGSAPSAINMVQGIVGVKRMLHGSLSVQTEDEDGNPTTELVRKDKALLNDLKYSDIAEELKKQAGLDDDQDFKSLSSIMKEFIKYATSHKNVNLSDYIDYNDMEVTNYVDLCQNIIDKLRIVGDNYSRINDLWSDIAEFSKLYNDSSEMSTISSAWLGLNQGLPTSEFDLLARLNRMNKIVTSREKVFSINDKTLFDEKNGEAKREELITKLLENNPTLERAEIEDILQRAHDMGMINNFDMTQYLTNDEYKEMAKDYMHIIRSTFNVFDMMEYLPHYQQTLSLFKDLVTANNTLSSKSRLINKLTSKLDNVTDEQLRGIIRFADTINAYNYLSSTTPIVVHNVEGYNPYYQDVKVDKIDLSTLNGISTLKHWVEHEFLAELRERYQNNPLVRHLVITPDDKGTVLATDIDLLNPNVSTQSRDAYDDILRGMAQFEKVQYDSDYTIADILQLYNIAVNKNQYGGQRLTTAFKVCSSKNNVLNKYLEYLAAQDWDYLTEQDFNSVDYQINSAPMISKFAESYHQEPFVKVIDPIRGFILKKLNANNQYEEYPTYIPQVQGESTEEKLKRFQNFQEECPLELVNMHNTNFLVKSIDFKGEFKDMDGNEQKDLITQIKSLLTSFSTSNKIYIVKDC